MPPRAATKFTNDISSVRLHAGDNDVAETEIINSKCAVHGSKYAQQDTNEIQAILSSTEITQSNFHAANISDRAKFLFIDQQAFRQPNNSHLRTAVRSHAKRQAVKRGHVHNTPRNINSRSLRKLVSKKSVQESSSVSSDAIYTSRNVDRSRDVIETKRDIDSSQKSQSATINAQPGFVEYQRQSIVNGKINGVPSSANMPPMKLKWLPAMGCELEPENVILEPELPTFPDTAHTFSKTSVYFTCRQLLAFPRAQSLAIKHYKSLIASMHVPNLYSMLVQGSWRQDPFDIHEALKSPQVSRLLFHYKEVVDKVWVSSKTFWIFQTSQEAMLHAVLFFTASRQRLLTASNDFDELILHHKGETMRIINISLNDPVERTSDGIIGALASLVMFEEMYGSSEAAMLHQNGLQQLLELRKASPDPRIHWFVQRLIVQSSVQSDPYTGDSTTAMTDVDAHPDPESELNHAIRSSKIQDGTSEDARTEVFAGLKNTTVQAANCSYDKLESFVIRRKIEGYLISCPDREETAANDISRSWLLAAMIFLHIVIATPEEVTKLVEMEQELVLHLRRCLERLFTNATEFKYPCSLLLWVLLYGGLCAKGDDRIWFRNKIQITLATAQLSTWADVKTLLQDMPWVQNLMDDELRDLSFGIRS